MVRRQPPIVAIVASPVALSDCARPALPSVGAPTPALLGMDGCAELDVAARLRGGGRSGDLGTPPPPLRPPSRPRTLPGPPDVPASAPPAFSAEPQEPSRLVARTGSSRRPRQRHHRLPRPARKPAWPSRRMRPSSVPKTGRSSTSRASAITDHALRLRLAVHRSAVLSRARMGPKPLPSRPWFPKRVRAQLNRRVTTSPSQAPREGA
jgi:hypothetical protein